MFKIGLPSGFNLAHAYLTNIKDVKNGNTFYQDSEKEKFVRPAPTEPRHGFVDSRVVRVSEFDSVLPKIADEMIAAGEPNGEMIIASTITARGNSVITPCRIVAGPGNDGATNGKNTTEIPLKIEFLLNTLFEELGIFDHINFFKGWPYIELVDPIIKGDSSPKMRTSQYTQIRGGPKPPSYGEGRKIKVERVIKVEQDAKDPAALLKWEYLVNELKKFVIEENITKTPVIWHPGGAITSHYGAHATINDIPYLTGEEPVVGQVMDTVQVIGDKIDIHQIREGLLAGLASSNIDFNSASEYLRGAVGIIHLMGYLDPCHPATARLIGFAFGRAVRVLIALPCGEARHATVDSFFLKNLLLDSLIDRVSVYSKIWSMDITEALSKLGSCQYLFQNIKWGAGYGGPKWAKCTKSLLNFVKAIEIFIRKPTIVRSKRLIILFNAVVNEAHNGGWWFNKLLHDNYTLDTIKRLPILAIPGFMIVESQISSSEEYKPVEMVKIFKEGFEKTEKMIPKYIPPIKNSEITEYCDCECCCKEAKTLLVKKEIPKIPKIEEMLSSKKKKLGVGSIISEAKKRNA
jgi:hypothetical protein